MPEQPPATESAPQADSPSASGEARGGYLGFVAHEMRNPLSTALWSAELIARLAPEERAGARGEKLAGMCLRSLQRLRLLVEDHFLAERLAVDGIPLRVEAVPVHEAVDAAAGRAKVSELAVGVPPELRASADRGLLERALEGLLGVAGRGPTPVKVDAARRGDEVVVTVRGAPVEPDALAPPRKGTASDPTGRALALHTASRVAQALGGALTATAEHYELSLPHASAPAHVES